MINQQRSQKNVPRSGGLKYRRNFHGFTIIEVIIVLAVAGVIMALVLGVVPQAQRNQRDNSRKALAQRLISSLENYNANNQGTYPFAGVNNDWGNCAGQSPSGQNCGDWFTNYVSGGKINITDPSSGANITIRYSNLTSFNPSGSLTPGDAYIGVGDQCTGSTLTPGPIQPGSPSSKQFAMIMAMEKSGVWYCTDNR